MKKIKIKIILLIKSKNEKEDIVVINNLHSKIQCLVYNSNKENKEEVYNESIDDINFKDTENNHKKKIRLPKGEYKVIITFDIMLTNCENMFLICKKIKSINFVYFDTKNVTDMSNMFDGCLRLQNLNLSKFNTEKVNNMKFMFILN